MLNITPLGWVIIGLAAGFAYLAWALCRVAKDPPVPYDPEYDWKEPE